MRLMRLSAVAFAPFLTLALYPQATGVPTSTPAEASKSVPVNVLYWAFFGHVTRLDNTAAALQRSVAAGATSAGTKPANLTSYYKRKPHLTDAEDTAVARAVHLLVQSCNKDRGVDERRGEKLMVEEILCSAPAPIH